MTSVKENVTQNGEEAPQTPLGLKVLVVVLGLAIIFMLGLIIWKVMVGGAEKNVPAPVTVAPTYDTPAAVESFELAVVRPADSDLISTQVSTTEIVLHFRSAAGDTVVIVDRRTGKESRLSIASQ